MNKSKFRLLFLALATLFVGIFSTGAYFSAGADLTGHSFTSGDWASSTVGIEPTGTPAADPTSTPNSATVVLNEFLANPSSDESAPMPQGEWIELYNTTDSPINLSGWYIYDAANHALPIISGNIAGGSTTILAHGFLVVYRNGYSFSLNQGTDTVKLYNGIISTGTLVDSYLYAGTPTDKTWARKPDGTGSWTNDHAPTPGEANV